MSVPARVSMFAKSDFVFIGLSIFGLAGAIASTWFSTSNNPAWAVGLVWLVAACFIAATVSIYFVRASWAGTIHYAWSGMVVGWKDYKFAVSDADFENEIKRIDDLFWKTYPRWNDALVGCVIYFVEPTFLESGPGLITRKVAGLQDGTLILVGWHSDLKQSALAHEIGHRVLQELAGDPPEAEAHAMLAKMGV